MSARPTAQQLRGGTSRRRPTARQSTARRRSLRRRRFAIVLVALAAAVARRGDARAAVCTRRREEITLPLRHEDIIRQQAQDKNLAGGPHRRRHLRRVAVPRPDVAGRSEGAHADHAGDRAVHRAEVRRHGVRAARPRHAADQHRIRQLVPALSPGSVRRATSCWRSRRTTAARATSTAGWASTAPRTGSSPRARSRSRRPGTTCRRCRRCAASTAAPTAPNSACSAAIAHCNRRCAAGRCSDALAPWVTALPRCRGTV